MEEVKEGFLEVESSKLRLQPRGAEVGKPEKGSGMEWLGGQSMCQAEATVSTKAQRQEGANDPK